MHIEETAFDTFWEASSLDKFNVQQFAQKLSSYDSDGKELLLEHPDVVHALPQARTQLNKLAKKRQSDRVFSGEALSLKELGRLLSSCYAWNGLEHRGYPSAGATYATEIFCVAFSVKSYTGNVLYYDAEKHGVVVVSEDAPSWEEAAKSLNVKVDGMPCALVVLVSFPNRAIGKYGERGGRFALLEAGAVMQQLSLQVAESSKLKGVVVGGILDTVWKQQLGLGSTDARIVVGYLVGK